MSAGDSISFTAQAPGKVLLTGGYLVTEREYDGFVIVSDASFHTTCAINTAGPAWTILAKSPQFNWQCVYQISERPNGTLCLVRPSSDQSPNRYVEISIVNALAFALGGDMDKTRDRLAMGQLVLTIRGDNDFYSQRYRLAQQGQPTTLEALKTVEPFAPLLNLQTEGLRKTGLGSSAALTTSVTAAILSCLGAVAVPGSPGEAYSDESRRVTHNVSQFSHCLAQGRVGSGFDVSSAVHGSHQYRRFSPAALTTLLAESAEDDEGFVSPPVATVFRLLDDHAAWDSEASPVTLPPGISMVLADIDAGTNTPSMIGQVNSWRKAVPTESLQLWTDLAAANAKVVAVLDSLNERHATDPVEYTAALDVCSTLRSHEWAQALPNSPTAAALVALAEAGSAVRAFLRRMGDESGAPIEPRAQTLLIDHTLAQAPGAIFGCVPGAGGFDAVACLCIGQVGRQNIVNLWESLAAAGDTVTSILCPSPEAETAEVLAQVRDIVGGLCPLVSDAGQVGLSLSTVA
ncbi:hypothetical protein H696_00228 [Fonticula alba]|uniref:phosphomevalonate kinase n=1 Tax=Fonticula alba TaxID=691883 RepID=A0A058ZGM5_FONAL|nr:hypothetical protein H696_00228 [Fonticula alba]KCV72647.1 hypothetical protein H696_00228 [Fonticula alba]|eukprot:XP_009492348.1 hypothetical protein H696_00228 [Fonticula alba]